MTTSMPQPLGYIQLTRRTKPILVNTDRICAYSEDAQYGASTDLSYLILTGRESLLYVDETADQISEAITAARILSIPKDLIHDRPRQSQGRRVMTIRPLIDPTKLARLRDLWLQGTPVKVIVNELGLKNVDQVQYWRKRLGLPNRWRKKKTIIDSLPIPPLH